MSMSVRVLMKNKLNLTKTTKICKLFVKKLLRIGEEVIKNSAQAIAVGILTIRHFGNRELLILMDDFHDVYSALFICGFSNQYLKNYKTYEQFYKVSFKR